MKSSSTLRLALVTVAAALNSSRATANGAVIVGDPSGSSYASIDLAVASAVDGDVIVVAAGTYAGFPIDDKSIAIFAAPGASVQVKGTIEIRNLAANRSVLLAGLAVKPATTGTATNAEPGLKLTNDAGFVRAQNCQFSGVDGFAPGVAGNDGGAGAVVDTCSRVAFANCTVLGGRGEDSSGLGAAPGRGGSGIRATGSSLALYDSTIAGNRGGDAYFGAGDGNGGDGCSLVSGSLFAAGSNFRGGDAGNAWSGCDTANVAGNGLAIGASAAARLFDDVFAGGAGGHDSYGTNCGGDGVGIANLGSMIQYPGAARHVTAQSIIDDQALVTLQLAGQPGDRFFLPSSLRPGFAPTTLAGEWLVPFPPLMTFHEIGTIPASGALSVQIPAPVVAGGRADAIDFRQGFVLDAQGHAWLAGPLTQLTLERSAQPDCNGNGVADLLDVFEATAADCNSNLIPDACEIASGAESDCNGNGALDSCDIANGTSQDQNANGVPDECEATGVTYYVDAAAATGGDGSQAHPFQTIHQGIAAALSGDVVTVLDGVYVGAGNRDSNFGGKDLVVRSQNGPSACIIDCQFAGSAFIVNHGETSAARIEGFTIQNGFFSSGFGAGISVLHASPRIAHCAFLDCSLPGAGSFGGALYLGYSNSLVDACTFDGNRCAMGGAIAVSVSNAVVRASNFSNNSAFGVGGGGAIFADVGSQLVVSHCSFVQNHSDTDGGGAIATNTRTQAGMLIDDCLFAGNRAVGNGGAIFAQAGSGPPFGANLLAIANCTFAGNQASLAGGALGIQDGNLTTIANCIAWGDSASVGPELALLVPIVGTHPAPTATVTYCDFQGGQAAVSVAAGSVAWSAGNLALDPQFVDPDGADGDPSTFADNVYRLKPTSPCLDAGDNSRVALDLADIDLDGNTNEPVPLDLNLKPRFKDLPSVPDTGSGAPPLVDLGCYERQS